MLPTVGRVVHYEPVEGTTTPGPWAAIVTAVDGQTVSIAAFCPPGSPVALPNVPGADEPTPGHWNWPPRDGPDPRGIA